MHATSDFAYEEFDESVLLPLALFDDVLDSTFLLCKCYEGRHNGTLVPT